MKGFIRIDISTWKRSEYFLIPTISISRWLKGFEITFCILCFVAYASIGYIKEDEYEY